MLKGRTPSDWYILYFDEKVKNVKSEVTKQKQKVLGPYWAIERFHILMRFSRKAKVSEFEHYK